LERKNLHNFFILKMAEREFQQLNHQGMELLRQAIELKQTVCYYCKEKIDFKKDKYGIWNYPDRLICNSTLCTAEALEEDESNNSRNKNSK